MFQNFGRFQVAGQSEDHPGHFNAGVFRAIDSLTNRLAAVVAVWPEDCTIRPDLVAERFPAEAALSSRLTHPNIAAAIDAGVAQDLTVFTAYAWVRGRSLARLLQTEGAQPPETVRELVWRVASALDYAASQGVVHGALYPGLIWLNYDGPLQVVGFGMGGALSMVWENDRERHPAVYSAPERVAANPKASPQTDQFALAVIAYELLAGRHPFAGADLLSTLAAIAQRDPVPIHEANPSAPAAAWPALRRALAKDPGRRFANCGEFVAALAL